MENWTSRADLEKFALIGVTRFSTPPCFPPRDPGLPAFQFLSPLDSGDQGILVGRGLEPRNPQISIRQSGASIGNKEDKHYCSSKALGQTKDSHLKRYRGTEARKADTVSAR